MSTERRNKNVPTEVLVRMRDSAKVNIADWERTIADYERRITASRSVLESESKWLKEVQEELDLRVKELADQAKICGATHPSIDNGAPCTKRPDHVNQRPVTHQTERGFWWTATG